MMHRWNRHVYNALHSRDSKWHFPNAIRKYGPEAFSHEVLAQSWTLEGANITEEELILQYETLNPKKGFNVMRGGGVKPSHTHKNPWDNLEYRLKMSAGNKTRWQDPILITQHRVIMSSLEVRAKIGAAHDGKNRFTTEIRNKIAVTRQQSTIDKWNQPISMTCKKHGSVASNLCLVGRRPSGAMRIECKLCHHERDTDRHRRENTYSARKQAGLCTRCGHNANNCGVSCESCRQHKNEKRRKIVI
jgi:hypothetical protein